MVTYTAWLGRRRSRMVGTIDNLPPDLEKLGFFARFRRSQVWRYLLANQAATSTINS